MNVVIYVTFLLSLSPRSGIRTHQSASLLRLIIAEKHACTHRVIKPAPRGLDAVGADTEKCTRRLTAPWPCQPDNESSECQHQQVGQCPENYGCGVDRRSGAVHLRYMVLYHVFKLRLYLFYAQTNLPLSSGYFHGRATLPIHMYIVCLCLEERPRKTQSSLGGVVHLFCGSQRRTEMPVSPLIKVTLSFIACNGINIWACVYVCVLKSRFPFFLSFPAMQRSVLALSMDIERTVSACRYIAFTTFFMRLLLVCGC